MTNAPNNSAKPVSALKEYRLYYFSELLDRPVRTEPGDVKLGKLTDMVFRLVEPFPEAVGLYLEHGWGKPTEFIPWDRLIRIDPKAIIVKPPEGGHQYPPFQDQPGWLLLNEHLMGKTVLDMDGRKMEVVNDIHLLESQGRMAIAHVDVSFNGFLRKWGLGRFHWIKDRFISWRYVQPLSVEDAVATDAVSLSIRRKQIGELPAEDLADMLEELSGEEQQAVFSALDSEKAADTLMEAEPRAQRQIVANLRQERARAILSEMSVAQLSDLFSVLPLEDRNELLALLPKEQADRAEALLADREAPARSFMSSQYVAMPRETTVGEALHTLRTSQFPHEMISYVYVVSRPENLLQGVVDVRELLLASDQATLGELMVAPVVSAEQDETKDDLAELFAKYHFHMIPVVDPKDHLLGVIHYNDIMKGLVTRART